MSGSRGGASADATATLSSQLQALFNIRYPHLAGHVVPSYTQSPDDQNRVQFQMTFTTTGMRLCPPESKIRDEVMKYMYELRKWSLKVLLDRVTTELLFLLNRS
jgi:hypothetical protein